MSNQDNINNDNILNTDKLQIERIKLKDLKRAEYNPRKNSKEQQKHLSESLKKYGCVEPIIVNRNKERYNIIIGGHFRVQELLKLGKEEVDCVIVNLNLADEKELNLRLNSNTGSWDYELLYKNFNYTTLQEVGFDFNKMEAEATKLLERYNNLVEEDNNREISEEDEIIWTKDNKRNIKEGDLFILKNPDNNTEHRLICGDSLNEDNIKKLMNNKKANMIFTDPPYNINVATSNNSKTNKKEKNLTIANDNLSEEEFNIFLDKSFNMIKKYSQIEAHNYICCNMKCIVPFKTIGEKYWNKDKSTIFIWIKDLIGLGWSYREKYETILFYTEQPQIKFYDKTETNVWEAPKSCSINFRKEEKDNLDKSTSITHPTIKPTSLMARAIKNSSLDENDIILDIFGGSGSTLIASERMKRNCYMSELDPYYCNVIIDRWEKLTGKKAIRVGEDKDNNKGEKNE